MSFRLLLISFSIFSSFFQIVQAQIEPLNSPFNASGSFDVLTETLTDATPSLLTYRPSSGGDYPVFLFQPGANGFFDNAITVNSYDLYMQHLASYGFVVVVIDNTQGGPNNNLFSNVHDRLKTFANNSNHWMSSVADISKLVVGGHSNGGLNATKLILSRPDEVMGIVYMASYPNPGAFGVGADNVSSYSGHVMLMVGDEDATSNPFGGSTNATALEAYNDKFQAANCKTYIEFTGVGHSGFGDYEHDTHTVGTIGRDAVTASVRHYLVSFMDRTTKNNALSDTHFMQVNLRPNSVATFLTNCVQIQDNSSSLDEVYANEWTIYPNPAAVSFSIDMHDFSSNTLVQLYSIQGQLLMTTRGQNILDIHELSVGMYHVYVDGLFIGRLIKQ